jgi:hypothetical protein
MESHSVPLRSNAMGEFHLAQWMLEGIQVQNGHL